MKEVVLIQLFSYHTVGSKQNNENTEYHDIFILLSSQLYSKQGGSISPMFSLTEFSIISSRSFFNNSNLIIIVDVQHLHENDKLISCVSNEIYTLSKKKLYCLYTLFYKITYFIYSRVKAS